MQHVNELPIFPDYFLHKYNKKSRSTYFLKKGIKTNKEMCNLFRLAQKGNIEHDQRMIIINVAI
jgi:hypothetical protein